MKQVVKARKPASAQPSSGIKETEFQFGLKIFNFCLRFGVRQMLNFWRYQNAQVLALSKCEGFGVSKNI